METPDPTSEIPTRPPRRRRWWRAVVVALLALAAVLGGHRLWTRRAPVPETEIFPGILYACERLSEDAEGSGLLHYARADLSRPGVEVFVTPLDAEAAAGGRQYRLRYVASAARAHGLAVAVNGTFYNAHGLPLPGRFANAAETVVADGAVNHVDPHSFLLWIDARNVPRLESARPPSAAVLTEARWAIGGNVQAVIGGKPSPHYQHTEPDARTFVGLDAERRLWMVVFENVSQRRAALELVRLGVTDAIPLDGGSSSEMTIGRGAAGVRPGSLIGTWMPCATQFGVRVRR